MRGSASFDRKWGPLRVVNVLTDLARTIVALPIGNLPNSSEVLTRNACFTENLDCFLSSGIYSKFNSTRLDLPIINTNLYQP